MREVRRTGQEQQSADIRFSLTSRRTGKGMGGVDEDEGRGGRGRGSSAGPLHVQPSSHLASLT